jgi:hypothetical protein
MNRICLAAAALVCLLAGSTFGQTLRFEKTIDAPSPFVTAEWGYAVRPTIDGGIVVTGFTATALFPLIDDVLLVKCDMNGDTLWTATYGGDGDDGGRDVVEVADGGFAVVGMTQSFGSADVYLVRTDAQGRELWSRTYGGPRIDTGEALCTMPGGGWLLVGSAADSTGDLDIFAVRTNANGDALWSRRYGGPGWQGGAGVCAAPGGGAVITGYTSNPGLFDACLLAVDANGDSLWTRSYGGPDEDWGSDVTPTADGGYLMVGTTDAFFGAGFSGRAWALRTDGNGEVLWSRTFGIPGSMDAQGNGGHQTAEGGYVLAGSQISPAGDLDVFVARLNAIGSPIWSRRYDRHGSTDHGADVRQADDGEFLVTGYSHDLDTWYDVYLTKIGDDVPTAAIESRPLTAVRLRPNPFRSATSLEIDPLPNVRRWQILMYDAAGRCVRRQDVRDSWRARIERGDLAAGAYFYEIRTDRGPVGRGKLTVR